MNPEEQKFWDEFNSLLNPTTETQVEYRLYYDINGDIILCSMHEHPEFGDYIVVDKTIYDNYFQYRIVDNRLIKMSQLAEYHARLKKSSKGFTVVKNHASILVEPDEKYTDIEYYEPRNN